MNLRVTIDNWRFFAYRRLAGLVTCKIQLPGNHCLALDSKFQVNSLQDVFCHPFYWQLYSWLTESPKLVVDLGAHCGHFSMLADVCVHIKFSERLCEYLLVEANPELIPVISRNFAKSGLCSRHVIKSGLVGERSGSATLWVSRKNYLSASVKPGDATQGIVVDYINLDEVIGNRRIDLLKVDIEGAEFALVENYPALLQRVDKLMIEIHGGKNGEVNQLEQNLWRAGLRKATAPIPHGEFQLAAFERFSESHD